ncbi:hypothetical protein PSACC_03288 [Paramicrosporidium saccamoebae]|uniref:Dolichyl-phosphate-mannose--protein mannosyltransferase n=1 Tax=Paramicrosporidium saccamoebae TaxID=1246581 RepID=A0A2H9TGK1_9FUNG|nr:hypothetical protein PSACC_03288 [Paramicrosporidium saccamoebae]
MSPRGATAMTMIRKRHTEPSSITAAPAPTIEPNVKGRALSVSPVRKTVMKNNNYWTLTATRSLLLICVVSFFLRFALVNEPTEVVYSPVKCIDFRFDEVHFGGFASNYLRREYFFDVHPPLGKLIIAGMGYLFGYDGGFTFASIGQSYINSSAPYVSLRTFMVVLGVGSIALSYATLIEMGFSVVSATLVGGLLAFDNALVVQSRFILLDSIMMFFISAAVYAWIKFRQQRDRPFKTMWWLWLALAGLSIGGATSVKMVGLFTVGLIGVATVVDLWELADWKRRHSDKLLARHFVYRAVALILLPVIMYLSSYYMHFAVLTRTGPGDSFMSSDFQTTLQGNQMHEKSRDVYYGNTIRLKSRLEEIYLHSHLHNYPRQHEDGKISSEGQQVTGYPGKDKNNMWKVLPASNLTKIALDQKIPIRTGDAIRLLHVGTGKVLFTHDVASPLTRTNMEVTVVDPKDSDKAEASVWIVDVKTGGDSLKAHSCQFRLMNKVHNVALTNHQQPLPKWGFGQREVNGDKRGADENSKWIVWDIDEDADEADKVALAMKPKPKVSFWQKFTELQRAQIRHNAALIDNHPFKSDPISWPFVLRGVSYWDKNKMGRIYLLGNPIAWYVCLFGIAAFCTVALRELFRARRNRTNPDESHFESRFTYRAGYLLLAWSIHYFPFFTMARTLYLHHYLPAYTMSAMVTGAIYDYGLRRTRNKVFAHTLLAGIAITTVAAFFYFAPITYGTQIATSALDAKKWGILKGYDQTVNLILSQCHERIFSPTNPVSVAQLGLYLIRGENVAVVGLIEEQLDAKVDYESLCAEPLMAVIH